MDDEIYVNASAVRPARVAQLLIEEVVGHKGIRSVVPAQEWNAFLDAVFAAHAGEIENTAKRYHLGTEHPDPETGKIVYSVTDPAKQRLAAEEWIAHVVTGKLPKPSWWKEFLQKVKLFLSKLPGFKDMQWTLEEIETLLARSARAMKKGLWNRKSSVEVGGRRDEVGGRARFAAGENGTYGTYGTDGTYSLKNAVASKDGYTVERVNENAGRDLNAAQGVVCEKINQVFDPKDAPKEGFKEWISKKIMNWETAHPVKGAYFTPALDADVNLEKGGLKSLANHAGPDEKYNLIPIVPEMLKNAVLVQTEVFQQGKTPSSKSHILASKVRYGKDQRYVAVMVVHESNGKFYYDHSLLVLEEGKLGKENQADNESGNLEKTSGSLSHSAQVLNVTRKALLSSGFDTKDEKNIRFAVSPVWTGSAADYEKPDLHYVGSGEGAQVYGWGLYGSGVEGIARTYAEEDVERKNEASDILLNGKKINFVDDGNVAPEEADAAYEQIKKADPQAEEIGKNKILWAIAEVNAALIGRKIGGREIDFYEASGDTWRHYSQWFGVESPEAKALGFLHNLAAHKNSIFSAKEIPVEGKRNLYKQTFWPGKEENLISWNEPVTEEQLDAIRKQLNQEFPEKGDWTPKGDKFIEYLNVGQYKPDGNYAYRILADMLGSPKAASEFLYRAGIDGVKYPAASHGTGDGSKGWNYVAFSDKDIQIDEHIRFAVAEPGEDGTDGTYGTYGTAGRAYYRIPFAESVDSVINGSGKGEGLVFVRATPDALKQIGIPGLPVMMTKQHIRDIYNSSAPAGRNAHGMGEQLKHLPEMLEKPVAVIASKEKGRVVVISQYQDKDGKQIIVPVIIGTDTAADGGVRITANIAASAFGKKDVLDLLDTAIEKEKNGEIAVFGANKKIASKLPMAGTPIVPTGGFNAIHNIDDEGSPVKGFFKKTTDSLQFKRWFGDSKVVDENGEPLVVYHGTLANSLTEFKKEFIGSRYCYDDRGFFFIDKKSIANSYSQSEFDSSRKGDILACYVSLQKPLIVDSKFAFKNGLGNVFRDNDAIGVWDAYQSFILDEVDNKKADGVIIKDGFSTMVVAFEPNQIKSATDNVGTFDPDNPDIRFAVADYSTEDQKEIVTLLRSFVRRFDTVTPESCQEYLAAHNYDLPARDAWAFAIEARDANEKAKREDGYKRRDDWLYENILPWKQAVDYAGSSKFKVRLPSDRDDSQFSGSFLIKSDQKLTGRDKGITGSEGV